MASIQSVVREVVDSLSEGVSNFTLYVIKRRDAGAPIPNDLTGRVDLVVQQCSMLSNLAIQISEQGFNEFQDIQAKLKGDAAALVSSGKNMSATAHGMKGKTGEKELRDSWQKLADACSAIGNNCIELLKTIFKAVIDRIVITTDKLNENVQKALEIDVEQVNNDPEQFAVDSGNMATQTQQLAEYLSAFSEGEESAISKQKLKQAAEKLNEMSVQTIDLANICMDSPYDMQALDNYQRNIEEIGTLSRVSCLNLKEKQAFHRHSLTATPKPERVNESAPRGKSQLSGVNQVDPVKKPTTSAGNSSNKDQRRDSIGSQNWKPSNMQGVADGMKQIAHNHPEIRLMGGSDTLSNAIQKLATAAEKGQSENMLEAAREISLIVRTFGDEISAAAKTVKNPDLQDRLVQCSRFLKDSTQQLKILASVKATIAGEGMDSDQQLVSLTANIVSMWKETGDTLAAAKLYK